MGMFDYVAFECDCPKCGERVSEFQSKDGKCLMQTVPYWTVSRFYTSCKACDTWIEYELKNKWPIEPIDCYEMSFKSQEEKFGKGKCPSIG